MENKHEIRKILATKIFITHDTTQKTRERASVIRNQAQEEREKER